MAQATNPEYEALSDSEAREWFESLDHVIKHHGPQAAVRLFDQLYVRAQSRGVALPMCGTTPFVNTIPKARQAPFTGNRAIERRLRSIIRWNAMAMVVRANRELHGIGGHISTYASQATLLEVAFNHFLRAKTDSQPGDIVYFQGHASPGVYARAFLEGRLSEKDLVNFRRELNPAGGLSSYPHPWLMPEFWEFPTVSMGLSPLMAIYQARFNHYLADRGLKDTAGQKVWAFLGDGEMDEPESLGALTLASREGLDNLLFVVNCNLQRLDGPVRGNGKVIQELERAFTGAGWRVIKVIWGGDWDPLLEKDESGLLVTRMNEVLDGQLQKYAANGGAYIRQHFFGTDPRLLELVSDLTDDQVCHLRRGGHDTEKVFAAYHEALQTRGQPCVILAHTIKGYGLGEAGEGRNVTHQQKEMNERELAEFRTRFAIPISDAQLNQLPFYRPPEDSPEIQYLKSCRAKLGGFMPRRTVSPVELPPPPREVFAEFLAGSEGREVATTMSLVRMVTKLMQQPRIGRYVVPIVPDEARTFGMEGLFRRYGIYSHVGQLYEPVDKESLLYYNEQKDGQILEEGITEAGAMSSFIAAGTAYATHGLPMIPFFIYYSMFGLQRVGDLVWAAGDSRAKGFMVGGTAGRTTLSGEGLQHQDGHSHVLALPVPNLKAYDPAFAYELAVIVQDGIRRMYTANESVFYYLTVMNELYVQPPMPPGVEEGIIKGLYRFRPSPIQARHKVNLLGSGAILREALMSQRMLAEQYGIAADVWSVTSYKELHNDAVEAERFNLLHPEQPRRQSYLDKSFQAERGSVFVAASDYLKALPAMITRWIPGRTIVMGTDGFGRSDGRPELRAFFGVDAAHITLAALHGLNVEGRIGGEVVADAIKKLSVDTSRPGPLAC
jgi:pyruvate dehydrogenase E1 component